LCQNGGISVLSTVGKTEKSKVGGARVIAFFVKNSLLKGKFETLRCRDATTSSFVTKVQGEVFSHFHAVAVKLYSSMQNCLLDLRG
jgi:hypothetical protein